MQLKEFLIFSGVGDNENQWQSWCNRSNLYDSVVFYYGDDVKRFNEIKTINPSCFKSKGMIWGNFAENYNKFKHYKYILIVDSDLDLSPLHLEDTFKRAKNNNWPACQWSRDKNSYGYFNKIYIQNKNILTSKTNFIEMLFMMINQELISELVEKWNQLELKYSTGIDFMLSNIALNSNKLPFYITHKYYFYNPSPSDKGRREIDCVLNTTFEERTKKLFKIMDQDKGYWRIKSENVKNYI
jgi:hypothetical protein